LLRKGGKKSSKEISVSSFKDSEGIEYLERANAHYNSLQTFRNTRIRARNYKLGDQWSEMVAHPNYPQKNIREDEFIRLQGRVPIKQNIIGQLVRNVIGQYRKSPSKSSVVAVAKEKQLLSEMLSNALQYALKINKSKELDARNLEEFLISGCAITKSSFGYWDNLDKNDVKIRNVNPSMIFFNSDIDDPRVEEQINFIGEIIDTDINSIICSFAKTEAQAEEIRNLYTSRDKEDNYYTQGLTSENKNTNSFLIPSDLNKCRLFEVWSKDYEWRIYAHDYLDGSYTITNASMVDIARINTQRIELALQNGMKKEDIALIDAEKKWESVWIVRYITPSGRIIFKSETPYEHGSHPYNIVLHPLLDGNVTGLVSEIIDQQRYINRLINLIDTVMSSSAKNLLIVPEDSIPDGCDIDDFAQEWSRSNGVIKIKMKPGTQLPQVISAHAINTDAHTLLQLQLQLINKVSGVNEAMQGHTPKSGTPSSLYSQEAENSSTNIADIMETYISLKEKRDTKVLKIIRQYYREKRYVDIAGASFNKEASVYDPEMVQNIDAELTIAKSNDTPVYRQITEDFLMSLFTSGAIPVDILLENSSLPMAQGVLDSLKKYKENISKQEHVPQEQVLQE
ncbi:MAG: hypothetical protein RR328_04750, partial [Bacteroidales bacterium]